ncbi:MAG: DUF1080 domain-containing protein, partial [Thermoguttaceae bacterium]|nr:DUF1080 domain-containing protein [Thermoguttaceae bacterium]MDW8037076.1 DUF1080 domain-containing protein [Thermoguttaceae bacterium]
MYWLIACCCLAWAEEPKVAEQPAEQPKVQVSSEPNTWLFVKTEPAGAEVFLNSKPVGKTNLLLEVQPGTYQIRLQLAGYAVEEMSVECPAGKVTRLEKSLRALPRSPQPSPPPPPPSSPVPRAPETPRSEVERLVAEAVTLYEKGETGAAQELLSKARQVADRVAEESLRDWLFGEVAKGYAQIMDHAGAIETTLSIRRGARYCRVAYEVVALLAQQDPEIAQGVYDTLFPKLGSPAWGRVPNTVRDDINYHFDRVPESALARKAIEQARRAHQEGQLPLRPSRTPKAQPAPSAPAPPAPGAIPPVPPPGGSSSPSPSDSSSQRSSDRQAEFVSLFDGQELRGWRAIGQGRWDVEGGAIVGRLDRPRPIGGFLLYEKKTFSDFILRLKLKIPSGNSGIMIRSSEGGWAGLVGLQIDLDASDRSITGSFFEVYADSNRRGRQVNLSSLDPDLHRQVRSEWTDMTIRAEGRTITVTVAGQQTAQWRNYAGPGEGLIALQVWGETEVMFKDI